MFIKIFVPTLCIAGLALGFCIGGAHAEPYGAATGQWSTMFTPPIAADGKNLFDCYLTNVSNEARTVFIYALDRSGGQVKAVKTTLAAGEEEVARAEAVLGARYCKFVVQGKKDDYRGSAVITVDGTGTISAIAAQ